ncbi:hypothetical protein UlMin_007421 [Ulmus minor]
MEEELSNFIKVWISIFISITYSYAIGKLVPKGTKRLLCLLPIVCLFLLLPLNLSSVHLGGGTAFVISWLGSFKLLLFAFGKGPLASNPSIPLSHFMVLACLPIEIQQNPPQKPMQKLKNGQNREIPPQKSPAYKTPSSQKPNSNDQIEENPSQKPWQKLQNGQNNENPPQKSPNYKNPSSQKSTPNAQIRSRKGQKGAINYTIKALLLAILFRLSDHRENIHQNLILILYAISIYLLLETVLATIAILVRTLSGLDLEPYFNEPYLSTSLQDFWGRRWNLTVTRILRPTVYEPTIAFSEQLIGRRWAPLPAVMATFLVSGLFHELIYFNMGRVSPTWEVTGFFLLQGCCLAVEFVLKKKVAGRWQLPRFLSVPLTVGFVMLTGFWLFFPQFLRCEADLRLVQEYAAFGGVLKSLSQRLLPFVW